MPTSTELTGQFWRCARCGKHLPARQGACPCGALRPVDALELQIARPAGDESTATARSPSWLWGIAAVGAVFGVIALLRPSGPPSAPPRTTRSTVPLARPKTAVTAPPPAAVSLATSAPGSAIPMTAATMDTVPATVGRPLVAPMAAVSVTGMEDQQAKAAPLRVRLVALSTKADELDAAFHDYRESCQRYRTRPLIEPSDDSKGGGAIPNVGGPYGREWFYVWTDQSRSEWPLEWSCREQWAGIVDGARPVKRELEAIEEAARLAGIIPGVMRDLRREYRLAFE